MTRIIDCVIAYNETEMLDIRTQELKGSVDAFVVVEANKTHRGGAKPLYFADEIQKYTTLEKPVIYYVIDDFPSAFNQSTELFLILENFHRNCIMRPLSTMGLDDRDIILISDIDEIPRANLVEDLPRLLDKTPVVIFEQFMKKYFINNYSTICANNIRWRGTVACHYGVLKGVTPQCIRLGDPLRARSACPGFDELRPYELLIPDGGWHFSSMGGPSAVDIKHRAFFEGDGTFRFIDFEGRFGRHNRGANRDKYSHIYSSFLHEYCPDLTSMSIRDQNSINSLDIPNCIKVDPNKYEYLFYFNEPID